jgi:L-threonylcarbamoyladenylate synthase
MKAVEVAAAVAWLRGGGIVAFPTDTLYGLTADPSSADAMAALFDLKGRAAGVAVPFIAASSAQVFAWAPAASAATRRLAARFWPGPLSRVMAAPPSIVAAARAADGTVAVRVPAHDVARALADAWGAPLPATSANRSGEPPAASAAQLGVIARDARVRVIDAGPSPGGAPSTIVDARHAAIVLVRAGAVPWNRVLESLQE